MRRWPNGQTDQQGAAQDRGGGAEWQGAVLAVSTGDWCLSPSATAFWATAAAVVGGVTAFVGSRSNATWPGFTMLHAPKVSKVYMKLCEQAQGVQVEL